METSPPRPDELFTIFGRTKEYRLTEQTAHDAVDALAEIACDIIGTAQGAGVSLIDQDGTRLSAWSSGAPVHIADTHVDDRWNKWTAAAAAVGVRSCLSVPLLGKPVGLGAMKVYPNDPHAFSGADTKLLINLARSAAALLGHIQASDTPQRISSDVRTSLAERVPSGSPAESSWNGSAWTGRPQWTI